MNDIATRKLLWNLRRWQRELGRPGLVGVGLLLAAIVYFAATVPAAQARLAGLEQAAASMHERLQRAAGSLDDGARSPDEQLVVFYNAFPSMDAVPDLLDKIYRAAARHRLSLTQGEYRARRERSVLLTRYQIMLPVTGPYLQMREFVTDVLKEIPFIAIDNVSFQREKIGEASVEARINMTLYLAEAP
jgi:Tfp pilus assembly protein PilO